MANINPYLNFPGTAEKAFNFYKSVFGGEFLTVQRFKDIPGSDKIAIEDHDKIMHIALPIGKNNILMASDALESMGFNVLQGNNHYIIIDTDSESEAINIYRLLAEGGNVEQPLEKMFWGALYGSFSDKFGIRWMVNFDYNKAR